MAEKKVERITLKLDKIPRADFMIPTKPFFMSSFAFVQANRALGELTRDVIDAKANGKEQITLGKDRASALILYGINWAGKDAGILREIRDFLVEKTRELSKGEEKTGYAIKGLPSSVVETLKELGADFAENLTDKDLVEATLSRVKEREIKVIDYGKDKEKLEELEKALLVAVGGDKQTVWSDSVKAEIDAFTERLVKKFQELHEKDLDRESFYSALSSISEGITYEIQRPFMLYKDVMSGKGLFEALVPNNLDSAFAFSVFEDKIAALTTALKKAYDPEYRPEKFKEIRFADYSKATESPEALQKYLSEVMTPEMQKAYEKLSLFYGQYGFIPSAYELVEKAKEKGIENPFDLEGEAFMEFAEEVLEVSKPQPVKEKTEEEVEEELDDIPFEF